MAKYLFADLTAGTNSTFQPNAQEFYNKALLGANRSTNEFRSLVNVKSKVRVGALEFGAVLGAPTATFNTTGNADLSSKEIVVVDIAVNTEVDQYTLEQTFVAQWMRQGSNLIDFGPSQFMTQYYERLSSRISNDLELCTWQGDTTLGTYPLKAADGLEKKMKAAAAPTIITAATPTSITQANVLAELAKVIVLLPTALKYRKADLAFFVSPNIAQSYELAASATNTLTNVTESLGLTYQNIKMIVADGMSANKMVISLKDNFIFATDLLSDDKEIITIEMKNTTGDRTIRTISDIKFAVDFVNPTEIVTYGFA